MFKNYSFRWLIWLCCVLTVLLSIFVTDTKPNPSWSLSERERTLQGNTVSSNNNANTVSPVQQHSVGITGHTWSPPHSLLSTFSRCDIFWRSWDQYYDQTVNMQWSVDSVNFCVEKKVTENLCLVWMMTSRCFHYIKKRPLAFTEFDKQI